MFEALRELVISHGCDGAEAGEPGGCGECLGCLGDAALAKAEGRK
jgi:hypothetical protein